MFLDNVTRKLQVVLTAAKTTLDMPILVDWVDMTANTTMSGLTPSVSNGVTLVDILPAPAASTQRKVNGITIYNKDTAAKTLQVILNDNGTSYVIVDVTIQIDDTLGYTDTGGWYIQDLNGARKTAQGQSDAQLAALIHAASSKTTPVDADELPLADSATSFSLKKLTWANLKAAFINTANVWTAAQSFPSGTVTAPGITLNNEAGTGLYRIGANWDGYAVSGVKVLDISSTGLAVTGTVSATNNIIIAAGKGIDFSASSNTAGMTSELLNDYEEGTWTPVYFGTTGTAGAYAATTVGYYTKIGRQVTVWASITLTNKGSWTGDVQFSTLPFTPADQNQIVGSISADSVTFTGLLNTNFLGATTTFRILNATSGASSNLLATAAVANNSGFFLSITYNV